MVHIELKGSDYRSSSVISSSQRVLNLYLEHIPKAQGEPQNYTHYLTPGLTLLGTAPGGAIRGLYRASNGTLFCASGLGVYFVSATWTFTLVGSFNENSGNPVIFSDNGTTVIVCDGTSNPGVGYRFKLLTKNGWEQIFDAGWLGSNYMDFSDTYFIANSPGTPNFYISDSNAATFSDALDFAGKSARPDSIVAAVVAHRVVWLIGNSATEVWMDSGGKGLGVTGTGLQVNTFPFELMPGVSIQDGAAATYSIQQIDNRVLWLAQNINGGRYLLLGKGYNVDRVSTHAVEHMWNTYSRIDDAIAFTYMQKGHYYYVINFPTADKTWCYDLDYNMWTERCWIDSNGNERRYRGNFSVYTYETIVVGDWENGNLYALDENNYSDNGSPIKRLRTFPAILDESDNNKVSYKSFIAEMDVGQATDASSHSVSLSWSDDRGMTFGNPVQQPLGKKGEFRTSMKWNRLGISRSRVFCLEWTSKAPTALNGAFVDLVKCKS